MVSISRINLPRDNTAPHSVRSFEMAVHVFRLHSDDFSEVSLPATACGVAGGHE
jgi:hypothetical protein